MIGGLDGLATFYQYDTYGRLQQLVADGASYGFTNVGEPFLGSGAVDPDGYLFYDTIHPTAAVHGILGLEFIPEPGVAGLLMLGALVIAATRRRQRR